MIIKGVSVGNESTFFRRKAHPRLAYPSHAHERWCADISMAPGSEQHGEDVEAGGDNAAYRAALESWLDQALELREQHTTLDGLKSSMQDEEPSTCFPVMVCEEGDGPRTFLAAWLSMEPGDGEPSFYFQSLYFTAFQ